MTTCTQRLSLGRNRVWWASRTMSLHLWNPPWNNTLCGCGITTRMADALYSTFTALYDALGGIGSGAMIVTGKQGSSKSRSLADSPYENEYANFSKISSLNHDHETALEGTLSRIFRDTSSSGSSTCHSILTSCPEGEHPVRAFCRSNPRPAALICHAQWLK